MTTPRRRTANRDNKAHSDDFNGMLVRCLKRYSKAALEGGPIDTTTLERLAEIQAVLDQVRADVVLEARRQGLSWPEIGAGLGVTAQAARVRYTVRAGIDDPAAKAS